MERGGEEETQSETYKTKYFELNIYTYIYKMYINRKPLV